MKFGKVAEPTSQLESLLWKHTDKAFFAVIGAITKSIEFNLPSKKQLKKWFEAVRCENQSNEDVIIAKLTPKALNRMEEKLQRKWNERGFFEPADVTGTNIPGSGKSVSLRWDKKSKTIDSKSLLGAYSFTLDTAPIFSWQFLQDIMGITSFGSAYPNTEKFSEELLSLIEEKKANPALQDEAIMGHDFSEEAHLMGTRTVNYSLGMCHSVGNIGFLQQEAGKLRTVANPNRFVQWCSVPLGEVLSEFFYVEKHGHYTLNQDGGKQWAQRKLREGISLSSFDMSSATDRLDYKLFLEKYFKLVFETDDYPLLKRNLEFFVDVSSAPWTVSGLVSDLIGSHSSQMSWTVGQPLGLRPSFPMLSIMNAACAQQAVYEIDGKYTDGHFACVGDDLIIESRYAERYMDKIRQFNGKINTEKCLVSDKYAEFCSHLVTRDTIYPLKPKWAQDLDGSLNNVERFTTKGLKPSTPHWIRELHHSLAQYSLDNFTNSPYRNDSKPKSLKERVGVNTILTICQPALRSTEEITLNALVSRALKASEDGSLSLRVRDLASSWANQAYNEFQPVLDFDELFEYDSEEDRIYYRTNPLSYFEKLTSVCSTSVELPVKTEWDYRRNIYVPQEAMITSAKKKSKLFKDIDYESEGNLLSVTLRDWSGYDKTPEPLSINLLMELNVKNGQAVITFSHMDQHLSMDVTDEVRNILWEKLSPETWDYIDNLYSEPEIHSQDYSIDDGR
jgi:hypothetical protein